MEIRVTIKGGRARVETISMLEDLWHDFEFFKFEAARLDQPEATAKDRLAAKRYQRAALLMLVFYFEGVLNHWLKELLPEAEFSAIERKHRSIEFKVKKVSELAGASVHAELDIVTKAKEFRHALVHLKPGEDLELFDKISQEQLISTETTIVNWLEAVEQALKLTRHPNTEAESKELRDALGTTDPDSEGYTGPLKR